MDGRRSNPWTFIPLLYFMQSIPVTLVQDVSVVVYKDLGIQNEQITRWTSLIALPWGLQMLLGPFVDLSFTKRGWIVGAQAVIAVLLIAAAFLLRMPNAFAFSLIVLGATAVMSALCNIATDGFAILSMSKTEQARMAGFMSTFYRLGRLFCASLLVYVAGVLMRKEGYALDPATAWTAVLLFGAAVYGVLHLVGRWTLPVMDGSCEDTSPEPHTGEQASRNLARTLWLVTLGISGYFLLNACVRLVAHGLATLGGGQIGSFDVSGWQLPEGNRIPFVDWPAVGSGFSPVGVEVVQLGVCGALAALAFVQARRTIRNTEFGEALGTFVTQPGFAGILFFVVFYRFPEAMVGKMSALFLKDPLDKGGFGLPNEQLGILNGLVGVVGIVLGGIVGGWVVSRIGIRRAFLPLALAMHVPNTLYLLLAYRVLPSWELGGLNWTIGATLFIDQFGYGFGFAGYMVYLMWVAQRGRFTTSHYAIGTGMGALCIAAAGVVSGVVQQNFGYTGLFWAVMFCSIPGLIAILVAPLDDSHRQIRAEMAT